MSDDLLKVLYRDDRYIAIDKPAGLLVHRSAIDRLETRFCVQLLRDQVGERVYPCHRLDKPTSGVLVFALDKEALKEINEQFMSGGVSKYYHAIVRGWTDDKGRVDHPLLYVPDGGESRGGGLPQDAVTEFESVRKYEAPVALGKFPTTRYALVKLHPLTGRQHQLRRHMKHISHHIIGDTRYGHGLHNRYFRDQLNINRLLLHANSTEFVHPFTNERIVVESDIPREFDIPLPSEDCVYRKSRMENLKILINPYEQPTCAEAIFDMLDSYARDPMGGSSPLGEFARENLVKELQKRDWVVTFLAILEGVPVGLLIAMEGFSTFVSRPLMNIHDVAVLPTYRGKGIGKALFAAVQTEAINRGCCKLTLEVLSGNERAMRVYSDLGFSPYALDPEAGTAQFWEKKLV